MRVIKSELDYTGGGIWCAWGFLEDGTVFCGGDNESFVIFPIDVIGMVDEDVSIYDIDPEYECKAVRYTDDCYGGGNAKETYDIWKQIYSQHPECIDLDWLLSDLEETYKEVI